MNSKKGSAAGSLYREGFAQRLMHQDEIRLLQLLGVSSTQPFLHNRLRPWSNRARLAPDLSPDVTCATIKGAASQQDWRPPFYPSRRQRDSNPRALQVSSWRRLAMAATIAFLLAFAAEVDFILHQSFPLLSTFYFFLLPASSETSAAIILFLSSKVASKTLVSLGKMPYAFMKAMPEIIA
jgi:hypothetical protein